MTRMWHHVKPINWREQRSHTSFFQSDTETTPPPLVLTLIDYASFFWNWQKDAKPPFLELIQKLYIILWDGTTRGHTLFGGVMSEREATPPVLVHTHTSFGTLKRGHTSFFGNYTDWGHTSFWGLTQRCHTFLWSGTDNTSFFGTDTDKEATPLFLGLTDYTIFLGLKNQRPHLPFSFFGG